MLYNVKDDKSKKRGEKMKGFMRKFLSCVLIGMIFISFIGTSQKVLATSSEVNLTKENYNSTNYVQDTLKSLALNAEPFT